MTALATGGPLSRFAHLTGGAAAKAAKAEDGDDKKDKNKDAAKKADGDGDGDDEDNNEGDVIVDVDVTVEDPKEDDEEADGKAKGKSKGKASARKTSASAIRQAERARCAAIFAHPAAGHNGALAAELAFNTDLPASAAGALLAAAPSPVRYSAGLAARMETVPPIAIGADPAASDQPVSKDEEARALASAIVSGARASGVIRK